jgi:hypothetical protein
MQCIKNLFYFNKVWTLVEVPNESRHNIVGTEWILENKEDEDVKVVSNNAKLIAQDLHNQRFGLS